MDELTIGDKIYISSKRAAAITGYAKDYIGQLCREGRVEATLVGRSWYVLETSIREHRFGSDKPTESKNGEVESSEPLSTWEPPIYRAEEASTVPVLERKSLNLLDEQESQAAVVNEELVLSSAEDMQNAWREWFASRQDESAAPVEHQEAVEEPETEDAGNVPDQEQEVAVRRVVDEPVYPSQEERIPAPEYDPVPFTREVEEPVPVRREYAPVERPHAPQMRIVGAASAGGYEQKVQSSRTVRSRRDKAGKSNVALKAAFLAIAGIAILVTIIGSGMTDAYIKGAGIEYNLIRFIAGTSIID